MELNVIDVSRDGSRRQEAVKVRNVSGDEIRLWNETQGQTTGRPQRVRRQAQAGGGANRTDSGRRPVRRIEEGRRTRRPEIYERPPVRRSAAANARARKERERRRKRRRRKQLAARLTVLLFLVGLIALLIFALVKLITGRSETPGAVQTFQRHTKEEEIPREEETSLKPLITEDFLTVNEYSRPGEALEAVNNIFVHYTANSGTSAAQNRSYFENLGITGETSASAHFIIGYDGEIIQCIPLDEIGYAVIGRNYDSISIECCYLQDDEKFTEETYQSLIRLCAWLLDEYNLTPQDMKRHYDEGGKKCPLYFTEHTEAWEQFKRDLEQYMTEQNIL